ncbi:MAG: hypothetical protein R3331_10155 [Sulfurospirillaceae bacterium]|nr:hypothetical protein [Sulfurospirillaceae bacterium]
MERQSLFEKILSLLQGAAWALVVVGAFAFFISLYHLGLLIATFGGFIGSLAGFFFVIIFEIVQIQFEKLREIKKQTKLLEKLVEQNNSNTIV